MKYSVKVTSKKGNVEYLSFKGRTQWCKRVARKHAQDMRGLWMYHGYLIELEEN